MSDRGQARGPMEMFRNWGGSRTTEQRTEPKFENPQQQNNNNSQQDDKKNDQDSDDRKLLNDVWKDVDPNKENQQQNNQNQQQSNNQQQQQIDPKQVLENHLKENGLDEVKLSDQELEDFKEGKLTINDVLGQINQRVRNAYVNSMKNVNQLIDTKLAKAKEDMGQNTKNYLEGVDLRNYLETEIPYIKGNAVLGPVAESAFQRFYERTGKDRDKSLKLTRQMLKETAEQVATNDPDMQRSFNRDHFNTPRQKSDTNWLDVFQGKS